MDVILIDPTRDELADAIASAVRDANSRARSRTVSATGMTPYHVGDAAEHLLSLQASGGSLAASWRTTTGGGVPNSSGYAAESSALGVAWWTDSFLRSHWRVYGERVHVHASPRGARPPRVFGLTEHERGRIAPAALVYARIGTIFTTTMTAPSEALAAALPTPLLRCAVAGLVTRGQTAIDAVRHRLEVGALSMSALPPSLSGPAFVGTADAQAEQLAVCADWLDDHGQHDHAKVLRHAAGLQPVAV